MSIEKRYMLDNGEEVVCLEVVRSLPGRRLVFLGEYAGKTAFAKLFLDPKKSERHWRRELDGLNAFKDGSIATANILYAGKTGDQAFPMLILEQLHGVVSVKQAWDDADDAVRENILRRMLLLLVRHHQAGLCQTDLHLGNFLLSEQEIFSLDGAGVRRYPDGVSQDARLENLGLFIAQLAPEWESRIQDIYDLYVAESGGQQWPGSGVLLEMVRKARKGRWEEFRGKLFRNCTAFTYTKYHDGFQVVANTHVGRELLALLRNPDASFPGRERAIKNGNTCTVWSTAADGRGLVVKRYNVKNIWHGLKLRFLPGRGERSWINGHRLLFYGIPTPKPVALHKLRVGLFPIAYLLTEHVAAVSAREWFRDPGIAHEEKEYLSSQIARIFSTLQQQRISHGDLKATNILISGGRAMLIDLDAMRCHRSDSSFRRAWADDMRRFLGNWADDDYLHGLFVQSLKSCGIENIGSV